MAVAIYTTVLLAGAAALALWIDLRFPALAPDGVLRRLAAAGAASAALVTLPVTPSVATLLVVFLPLLTITFVTVAWLVRAASLAPTAAADAAHRPSK